MVDAILGLDSETADNTRTKRFSLRRETLLILGSLVGAVLIGLVINSLLGGQIDHPVIWFGFAIAFACVATIAVFFGLVSDRLAIQHDRELLEKLYHVRSEGSAKFRELLTQSKSRSK